jgi:hypothetical protein
MEHARRETLSVLIACPGCKRTGPATWEEFSRPFAVKGRRLALVTISPGFMEEVGKTEFGDPIVTCDCGKQFEV